jgi:hypothetical protein
MINHWQAAMRTFAIVYPDRLPPDLR